MPCVFYSSCTTHQAHYHRNNSRHHATFLVALASQVNQSQTANSESIHILHHQWVLMGSETWDRSHGSSLTTSIHISCVLKLSETNSNKYDPLRTASLHIFWLLLQLKKNSNDYGLICSASLHIFLV